MDVNLRDPRFRAVLLSVLALTALLVAAVGLYAVTSFDVAQRRYEIGVRMSLGARPGAITRLVLRQTCVPVAAGAGLALIGGWWLAQFAQSLLYNTSARDAVTYTAAVGVLLTTAAIAAWRPARRAAQLDPVRVLRSQ
jgi:ABC-type antimicrobial peptide transport system permease subunit